VIRPTAAPVIYPALPARALLCYLTFGFTRGRVDVRPRTRRPQGTGTSLTSVMFPSSPGHGRPMTWAKTLLVRPKS